MLRRRRVLVASSVTCLLILSLFSFIPYSDVASSTDASDPVNHCNDWYREQLDPVMSYAYDKIISTEPNGGPIYVEVPATLIRDTYPGCVTMFDYVDAMVSPFFALTEALSMDHPELDWDDEISDTWFFFNEFPSLQCDMVFSIVGKEGYQNNSEMEDVIQAIDPTGTDYEKVSQIHNYLADLLSYAYEEMEAEKTADVFDRSIRNVSVALIGTHRVVCEGYAKAFKMACDYYDIPNIVVHGYSGEEGHAWNLVFLDGFWYMVDLTWDDLETGYRSLYMLCGQKTVIGKQAISESHVEWLSEYDLKLPEPLAQYGYLEDTSNVFFKVESTEASYVRDYLTGSTIDATDIPSKDGFYFTGWYLDAGCNDLWNPEEGVTSDMVLYAGWSEELQYTLFFRSDGGSDVPEKVKTDAEGEVAIPLQTPSRSGYIFTGWNTKSDGSGSGYLGGDTMKLESDAVLYACWTSDGSEEREETEGDHLVLCVMFMVLVMPVLCVVCYRRFR